MANAIGTGTWMRCAHHLSKPWRQGLRTVTHPRSNDMSMSPWSPRISFEYRATRGIPGYVDAWHPGVLVHGEPGAQGTQMDAFGHWGSLNSDLER